MNDKYLPLSEFAAGPWASEAAGMTSKEEHLYNLELDIAKAEWIEMRAQMYRIGDESLPLLEDILTEERVIQRFMLELETAYSLNCPLKTAKGVLQAVEGFRSRQVAIAHRMAVEDAGEVSEAQILEEAQCSHV